MASARLAVSAPWPIRIDSISPEGAWEKREEEYDEEEDRKIKAEAQLKKNNRNETRTSCTNADTIK